MFSFVTSSSDVTLMTVNASNIFLNFSLRNGHIVYTINGAIVQLLTIVNEGIKHNISIAPSNGSLAVDGVVLYTSEVNTFSTLRNAIIRLGNTNNGPTESFCMDDVSFASIRILDAAFNVGRLPNVMIYSNTRNPSSKVYENICYDKLTRPPSSYGPSFASPLPTGNASVFPPAAQTMHPGAIAAIVVVVIIILGLITTYLILRNKWRYSGEHNIAEIDPSNINIYDTDDHFKNGDTNGHDLGINNKNNSRSSLDTNGIPSKTEQHV